MRISLALATCLLIAGFVAYDAQAASTDIRMLPPVGYDNKTICGAAPIGVLYWDGVNPIHCIPGFSGDQNGNVTIGNGTLTVAGAITADSTLNVTGLLSANGDLKLDSYLLNGTHATALQQLVGTNCNSGGQTYQVLTRINGVIQCADVTDIIGPNGPVGKTIMSSCPSGTALTSLDGITFTCVSIAPTVSSCPAGEVLVGVANGVPQCAAMTFSCPNGQILQGVQNGQAQCVAVPTSNPCQGVNYAGYPITDGNGNQICEPYCPGGTDYELSGYQGFGGDGAGFTSSGPVTIPNGALNQTITPASGYYLTAIGRVGTEAAFQITDLKIPAMTMGFTGPVPNGGFCEIFTSMTCTLNGWQSNGPESDGSGGNYAIYSASCPLPPPPPPPDPAL